MSGETTELIVDALSGLFARRQHPARRLALLGLAGVLGLLGLTFLAVAAYLALAERFSPPLAAALVGAGLALLAAGSAWFGWHVPARQTGSDLPIATLIELAGGLAGELEAAVQSAPATAAAAAFAAGCVVGSNSDLTRGLQRGLGGLMR